MSEKSAVGYYADRCGHLIADLGNLKFQLDTIHRLLRPQGGFGQEQASPEQFGKLAGDAAGLRSRMVHTLENIEKLLYACEDAASKGPSA